MKKLIISCALVASVIGIGAGSASAGKPVVQGCIGSTSSTNAQALGGIGERRSGFAKNENGFGGPGFGDEMQVLQAGLVPDISAPNTCNDPV